MSGRLQLILPSGQSPAPDSAIEGAIAPQSAPCQAYGVDRQDPRAMTSRSNGRPSKAVIVRADVSSWKRP